MEKWRLQTRPCCATFKPILPIASNHFRSRYSSFCGKICSLIPWFTSDLELQPSTIQYPMLWCKVLPLKHNLTQLQHVFMLIFLHSKQNLSLIFFQYKTISTWFLSHIQFFNGKQSRYVTWPMYNQLRLLRCECEKEKNTNQFRKKTQRNTSTHRYMVLTKDNDLPFVIFIYCVLNRSDPNCIEYRAFLVSGLGWDVILVDCIYSWCWRG